MKTCDFSVKCIYYFIPASYYVTKIFRGAENCGQVLKSTAKCPGNKEKDGGTNRS